MNLEVGSRIAHYDVTALIGEGGMGQELMKDDGSPPSGHSYALRSLT